jgi:hypothetical protein
VEARAGRSAEQAQGAELVRRQAGRQELVLADRAALEGRVQPRDDTGLRRRRGGEPRGLPQKRAVQHVFGDVSRLSGLHRGILSGVRSRRQEARTRSPVVCTHYSGVT